MRSFLPVTATELCGDLPNRELVVPKPAGGSGDALEWAEYEATVDASLASLELVRDTGEPVQRRIVLALDGDTIDWEHVVAILIDGSDAEDSVRRACEATTQDEADEALEELLDFALQWYDASERAGLARVLNGCVDL
ncbi:MAG: hypothetical protein Q4D87_06600 [Actinomycetaceae bacterium]|nr:hypothetical protein [Actinomycetaceae bacterium]